MTDHPLSNTPMRRSLARPPAQPASSCARCLRNGIIAQDQRSHAGTNKAASLAGIRFECAGCNHTWITNRRAALEHGAFLQRLNHATNRDV